VSLTGQFHEARPATFMSKTSAHVVLFLAMLTYWLVRYTLRAANVPMHGPRSYSAGHSSCSSGWPSCQAGVDIWPNSDGKSGCDKQRDGSTRRRPR
jgi:hypothetical protein